MLRLTACLYIEQIIFLLILFIIVQPQAMYARLFCKQIYLQPSNLLTNSSRRVKTNARRERLLQIARKMFKTSKVKSQIYELVARFELKLEG